MLTERLRILPPVHATLAFSLLLGTLACETRIIDGGDAETVASIDLTPGQITLAVGETAQLNASARNRDGRSLNATLQWSSSNAGIVELLGDGRVRGVSSGTATVTVRSGSVSNQAQVTVRSQPQLQLSRETVVFNGVAGGANPGIATVSVTAAGGGTLGDLSLGPIQYSGTTGWLSASLGSAATPATLSLAASLQGLTAGTYTATIEIRSASADNSPRILSITLIVSPPATVTHTLTIVGAGTGVGTVAGGPISCISTASVLSGTCQVTVTAGTVITLDATPAANNTFGGWSGACTGTGSCVVTMSADQTVGAQFSPVANTVRFEVLASGTGSGTVTGSGIACTITSGAPSGTCSIDVPQNTTITLMAAPTGGSVFAGWSGACTGSGSCNVTVSASTAVTATFNLPSRTLTISGAGSGNGKVTGGGIDCAITAGSTNGTCEISVSSGTVVDLTANVSGTNAFTGWSGACSGTGTCSLTVNSDVTVIASFSPIYTVTVDGAGTGTGTITGGGLSCTSTGGVMSGTCQIAVVADDVVTLSAAPLGGHSFDGWSGDCTGANCMLTVNGNKSVTATFTAPVYTLSVSLGIPWATTAKISSVDGKIGCTSQWDPVNEVWNYVGVCSYGYADGTSVTLVASGSGLIFTWNPSDCDSIDGSNRCVIQMNQNRSVTVNGSF